MLSQYVNTSFEPILRGAIEKIIKRLPERVQVNAIDHEDGSCTLEFVTQSLDETKRWVMTYGADAVVLEPAELRSMVRDEHARAASEYEEDSSQAA